MYTNYKITMQHDNGTTWLSMDEFVNENRAKRELQAYRDLLPRRTFRLEKHTMEVIG